jgi:hypothetical protein
MAYDYIGLSNEVLKAIGEETFADSTEFGAAVGLHNYVKCAVNYSIKDIYNQEQNEWSFAKTTDTITLVAGTLEYSTNSNAASIDWDSFFIQYDAALDKEHHRELTLVPYDSYRKYWRQLEENKTETTSYSKPDYVVRTLDNKAIFYPKSDDVYTVEYEYFARPTDLSASTDVPAIPSMYDMVIVSGALVYVHMYLDDEVKAQAEASIFRDKVNDMRRALIPQDDTARVGNW